MGAGVRGPDHQLQGLLVMRMKFGSPKDEVLLMFLMAMWFVVWLASF
jgi:hypothetical protein